MADATPATSEGVDWGRIVRVWVLIAVVTAVLLFTAASRSSDAVFATAVVGIGTVALLTAITGFVIGAAAALET